MGLQDGHKRPQSLESHKWWDVKTIDGLIGAEKKEQLIKNFRENNRNPILTMNFTDFSVHSPIRFLHVVRSLRPVSMMMLR